MFKTKKGRDNRLSQCWLINMNEELGDACGRMHTRHLVMCGSCLMCMNYSLIVTCACPVKLLIDCVGLLPPISLRKIIVFALVSGVKSGWYWRCHNLQALSDSQWHLLTGNAERAPCTKHYTDSATQLFSACVLLSASQPDRMPSRVLKSCKSLALSPTQLGWWTALIPVLIGQGTTSSYSTIGKSTTV